jgi:hypothetical protein
MPAQARRRETAPAPVDGAQTQQPGSRGNPRREGARGPFGGALNEALSAAFGADLSSLQAGFGEASENAALGAVAHTRGQRMSFGADLELDDPAAAELAAHEVAHALAGGGAGQDAIDRPGDPGEATADDAGRRFAAWVAGGKQGPPPKLSAARGGRAAVHRKAAVTGSLTGSPMLTNGSRGRLVSVLQTLLNSHGSRLSVDGVFGPQTLGAVRSFQRSNGLQVDGVVGPRTAAALNRSGGQQPAQEERPAQGEQPAAPGRPLADGAASAHFRLSEFACRDGTAVPERYIPNVIRLAAQLEVLRAELGGAGIHINSGYRTPAYNEGLDGAATNSQHLTAKAADISVSGHTPRQVADTIERLIREGKMEDGGMGRYSTFVHYDVRGSRARW